MKLLLLYILCALETESVISDGECERPLDLKSKEEYCFSTEVEIVERVVQKSRNFFNFVKEKIGIGEIDENHEPQNCKYYSCILHELHMLNGNSYPDYKNIKDWAEHHATYKQTLEFIKQLDKCNDALTDSKLTETYFEADLIDDTNGTTTDKGEKTQNACEIASEFIKCLTKNQECPVFIFP